MPFTPRRTCEACGLPKPANTHRRCTACQTAHIKAANEAFRAQCAANPHSWRRALFTPTPPPAPPPPLPRPVPPPAPPAKSPRPRPKK